MGYGEYLINSTDWSSFALCGSQSAEDLAPALWAFIGSKGSKAARSAWGGIENAAFAQNTIYGAAEPAVSVLIASLADDRPAAVRQWIVELLRFLLLGGSVEDADLASRCRNRARAGLWLLAHEARQTVGPAREGALEVLSLIDANTAKGVAEVLATPK